MCGPGDLGSPQEEWATVPGGHDCLEHVLGAPGRGSNGRPEHEALFCGSHGNARTPASFAGVQCTKVVQPEDKPTAWDTEHSPASCWEWPSMVHPQPSDEDDLQGQFGGQAQGGEEAIGHGSHP